MLTVYRHFTALIQMKASLDIFANLEYSISGISIFLKKKPYEDIYGLRFFFVEFQKGEMIENI